MLLRGRLSPVRGKWPTSENLPIFGQQPKEVNPNLSLQMGRIFASALQKTPRSGAGWRERFLTVFC